MANFQTDLMMPLAGARNQTAASLSNQGSYGLYWSSLPNGTDVYGLYFNSSDVNPQNSRTRAIGISVRCFKNSDGT